LAEVRRLLGSLLTSGVMNLAVTLQLPAVPNIIPNPPTSFHHSSFLLPSSPLRLCYSLLVSNKNKNKNKNKNENLPALEVGLVHRVIFLKVASSTLFWNQLTENVSPIYHIIIILIIIYFYFNIFYLVRELASIEPLAAN
jgi:hypothetical protein